MIVAVSSGHNCFGNARRYVYHIEQNSRYSSFDRMCNPTVPSLTVRDVIRRKWRIRRRRHFVCCSLRSMNQLFLFSGPSGVNFRVIPYLPTALGVFISIFRQRDAFIKGKVYQKKLLNE
jgi:hypothetical protein